MVRLFVIVRTLAHRSIGFNHDTTLGLLILAFHRGQLFPASDCLMISKTLRIPAMPRRASRISSVYAREPGSSPPALEPGLSRAGAIARCGRAQGLPSHSWQFAIAKPSKKSQKPCRQHLVIRVFGARARTRQPCK